MGKGVNYSGGNMEGMEETQEIEEMSRTSIYIRQTHNILNTLKGVKKVNMFKGVNTLKGVKGVNRR